MIISLKKGYFKSFNGQNKVNSSIYDEWIGNDIKRWIPFNNICVKEESVISNSLQSVFPIVLRREERSLLYVGQWSKKCVVDSTSARHLHNRFSEFWKLCLNLCSRRWLRPRRSFVRNLIPCGLWHANTLLGEGLINFRMTFLKVP